MVKKDKDEFKEPKQSAYRSQIYKWMASEKKDIAMEKLKEKGIAVGEGFNVSKLKKEYRKEKIKENIDKLAGKIEKKLGGKITSRAILKKQPRATYVIGADQDYERSSYFNNEYEREKNIISWK